MNILITGALSHLSINFLQSYKFNKIIAIDKNSYCSQDKKLLPNGITFIEKNINDINLNDLLELYKINIIINCLASTHVDRSYTHFNEFIDSNVNAVYHILESIKHKKIKLIHISTDEVYGGNTEKVFKETDILNPTNPYSASKASSEMLINSYYYSYNIDYVILRPNNFIGKYQYREKVIPKFIYRLINNLPIEIHGDGNQIRDFISTKEVARIINIFIHANINGIFNVGTDNSISINELGEYIFKYLKTKNKTNLSLNNYKIYINDRPYNDLRYKININKLLDNDISIRQDLHTLLNNVIEHYICFYNLKLKL